MRETANQLVSAKGARRLRSSSALPRRRFRSAGRHRREPLNGRRGRTAASSDHHQLQIEYRSGERWRPRQDTPNRQSARLHKLPGCRACPALIVRNQLDPSPHTPSWQDPQQGGRSSTLAISNSCALASASNMANQIPGRCGARSTRRRPRARTIEKTGHPEPSARRSILSAGLRTRRHRARAHKRALISTAAGWSKP